MRTPIAILGLAATAAVLTACGSDTAASTAPEHTVAGAAVTVAVDANDYRPEHVEIDLGETVAWSFQDRVDHDVAFDDGPASPIQRDGTWTRTFDRPGTYHYVCTLHRSMTGTVTVTTAP